MKMILSVYCIVCLDSLQLIWDPEFPENTKCKLCTPIFIDDVMLKIERANVNKIATSYENTINKCMLY